MRKSAFTLIELLVVCAIIGMLLGILLPALSAANSYALRGKCGTQLKNIGAALQLYANDNDQVLPKLPYQAGNRWNALGNLSTTVLDAAGSQNKCNTRALFTCLIRGGYAEPDRFICPGVGSAVVVKDSDRANRWDFPDFKAINYSFQNNWGAAAKMSNTEGCPIMADRNPQVDFDASSTAIVRTVWPADSIGGAYAKKGEKRSCNSPNHGYQGQNVLYAGGNVRWWNTPLAGKSLVCNDGTARVDNIYTRFDKNEGADGQGRIWGVTPANNGDAMWGQGAAADLDAWLVP